MNKPKFLVLPARQGGSEDLLRYGYSLHKTREQLLERISRRRRIELLDELADAPSPQKHIGIAFSLEEAGILVKHVPTYLVVGWALHTLPDEVLKFVGRKAEHPLGLITATRAQELSLSAQLPHNPVCFVPTVDWKRVRGLQLFGRPETFGPTYLPDFNCNIIDSREFDPDEELIKLGRSGHVHPEFGPILLHWDGSDIKLSFRSTDYSGMLMEGFYSHEPWGVWSRTDSPSINLPYALSGEVELTIEAQGYGANVDRAITVRLGAYEATLTLGSKLEVKTLFFKLDREQHRLSFDNLDLTPPEDAVDTRTMGIGIRSVTISAAGKGSILDDDIVTGTRTALDGVIYTAVLPSADAETNWKDLVTGFRDAFSENQRATLILQIASKVELDEIMGLVLTIKKSLPFRCRYVIFCAELNAEETTALMGITHFYVTSSKLLACARTETEFLACGIPVIAPAHACLQDSLNPENSFQIGSSLEPVKLTSLYSEPVFQFKHRLDWSDLVACFNKSFEVAQDKKRYSKMRKKAKDAIYKQESEKVLSASLKQLSKILELYEHGTI